MVIRKIIEAVLNPYSDQNLANHNLRVAKLTVSLARLAGITDHRLTVFMAGLLHDVGKMSLPQDIINKPGPLNESEFTTIKTHPILGANILKQLGFNTLCVDACLCHHERLDGAGYPNGVTTIPLIGRVVAVADVYDAITSDRAYRKPLSTEYAFEVLKGSGFDQTLVDLLYCCYGKIDLKQLIYA